MTQRAYNQLFCSLLCGCQLCAGKWVFLTALSREKPGQCPLKYPQSGLILLRLTLYSFAIHFYTPQNSWKTCKQSYKKTLLYLSVSTCTVIGKLSSPYSTVRPAKFKSLFFSLHAKCLLKETLKHLKCIWHENFFLLISKTFQNTEEWHFSFWNIFFCFRGIDIFLLCKLVQWWCHLVCN